jgi:HSP20 family protein
LIKKWFIGTSVALPMGEVLKGNIGMKEVFDQTGGSTMFLTKWTPKENCNTLWDCFENDLFPTRFLFGDDQESVRRPLTNINETDDAYLVTMEMPGVSKKNVEVSLEGDTLTITGERVEKLEDKGLLRREIRQEKFSRSFRIDESINRDQVKAKMDNGILTVTLPKSEKAVGRKVNID